MANPTPVTLTLEKALRDTAREVESVLERIIVTVDGPESGLFESMRYATLGGG